MQYDRIEMGVVFIFSLCKAEKRPKTVIAFMSVKTGLLGFSFVVKSWRDISVRYVRYMSLIEISLQRSVTAYWIGVERPKFLDVMGIKVLRFPPCYSQTPLLTDFTLSPRRAKKHCMQKVGELSRFCSETKLYDLRSWIPVRLHY